MTETTLTAEDQKKAAKREQMARARAARKPREKKVEATIPASAPVSDGFSVEGIADLTGIDYNDRTLVLDKDPNYIYRIVLADAEHVTRAKALGYRAVKRDEPEQMPMLDHGRVDHIKGFDGGQGGIGIILMKAPRRYVEERKARQVQANRSRAKRDHEKEIEEALRSGVMTDREAKLLAREGYIEERAS